MHAQVQVYMKEPKIGQFGPQEDLTMIMDGLHICARTVKHTHTVTHTHTHTRAHANTYTHTMIYVMWAG